MSALPAPSRLDGAPRTKRRLELNHRRNLDQDHTAKLDAAAKAFDWVACRDQRWNPEELSLLWGTRLWDQASETQRLRLNQLYWVAYYADIISAEIATIYFNQTSAASLYGLEDFRGVCDMLDLESSQERAHINAFKTVGEAVEAELFGERVFTYEMRGPFAQTVTFADTDRWRDRVRRMLLRTFGVLSAQNAFVGCQYFLVRGLRTLLGKIVQHRLASFVRTFDDPTLAPVPTQISDFHFQDESYHFNSSTILSHDVLKTLPTPTRGERFVMNRTIEGAQRDLRPYCVVGDGVNWHGPQTFDVVYRVLRSKLFAMDPREALEMMRHVYTEESDGLVQAQATHATAVASYRQYLDGIDYLTQANREVRHADGLDVAGVLKQNRRAWARFRSRTEA